ncbi:MAG: carboxypeptidase regulatory-like domain-containing protein [Candidatus Sumerlaeia bacterium]
MSRWGGWLLLSMLALALAGCGQYPGSAGNAGAAATPAPRPAAVRVVGEVGLAGRGDASGVQVYIPGTPYVSITGQRGRYELRGIEPGEEYSLMARADGFETLQLGTVLVDDPPTTTTYRMPKAVLKPAGADGRTTAAAQAPGRIEGEVVVAGDEKADLAGCQVELQGTPFRTVCGADGQFLLWSIPPGLYTIRARLDRFAPTSGTVQVAAGAIANPRLTLRRPQRPSGDRRITGFVEMRGPAGRLTGEFDRVTVRVDGRPDKDARVGADGTFNIAGLPAGRYNLTASARGYQDASSSEIDLTDLPTMAVQLRMIAAAETGAAATPAPMAVIRGNAAKNQPGLTDMSGINIAVIGTSIMAVTDAEGNFTLNNVPAGSRRVIAQAEGFKEERVGPFELSAGQDLLIDPIVLDPSVTYPRVISTNPADGARNVMIDREIPIQFRFNKKMNAETLRRAVRVVPPVDFRVFTGRDLPTTNDDVMVVTLYGVSAANPTRFRTNYRITIGADARDVEGFAMQEPFELGLRTGGPAIVGTIPPRGGLTTGAPHDPIIVRFNAPIDPATISSRSLKVQPRVVPEPNVAVATDPDSKWSRLLIQTTLDPDTAYRITLGSGVRTINNMPMDNTPYSFNFRTEKMYQLTPPAVPQSVR